MDANRNDATEQRLAEQRLAEQRLTELETRLAHHERMAEELSSVMFEQGRTIDLLTLQVRRLRERVAELEAGPQRAPQDEAPPPHY